MLAFLGLQKSKRWRRNLSIRHAFKVNGKHLQIGRILKSFLSCHFIWWQKFYQPISLFLLNTLIFTKEGGEAFFFPGNEELCLAISLFDVYCSVLKNVQAIKIKKRKDSKYELMAYDHLFMNYSPQIEVFPPMRVTVKTII